ncbi:MAG: molecular chaperone [Candidatus Andeanibacterium colombiense]|uniref:Molecular chaperone n=1 Tax=Candidatus Andeanibacterium colombiense TaxID=3121345 RepID=A0AAJ5X9L9_9SPHN|nr:MAG: molecular chaperone [Sphingomonadaceae bacterium]
MKRFYKDVAAEPVDGGWRVTLDGRGIKTQNGAAQVVPNRALAEALAAEWASQGDEIDPARFIFRDLADYAIDIAAVEGADLLRFAETDTLCYRAEPGDPLHARQEQLWEPLLTALEARYGIAFERISGVLHRPQPPATLAALKAVLDALDPFTLAALHTMTSLAASLAVGLAGLEPGADPEALYAAANAEEDWQAEHWGWEWTAEEKRAAKLAEFKAAFEFARLARAE